MNQIVVGEKYQAHPTQWLIYAQATKKKHEEWVESRRSRLDKK